MPHIRHNPETGNYELYYAPGERFLSAPEVQRAVEEFRQTEDVSAPTPAHCACESCKVLRSDPTQKLRSGTVHQYSYRPRGGWKLHRVSPTDETFAFGVELETDRYFMKDGLTVRSDFSNQQAVDMRRPKRLWVAKSDASVSGPEFVSHPATLAYWKKNEENLRLMFRMLVHAGYRSHDNDKAGMHINISRSAFADADHLYRFMMLIYGSPTWSLRMSQRSASSMTRWSPLDVTPQRMQEVARTAMTAASWRATTNKYAALNIPQATQGRMEFRLPRGTLRLDRFMKNLEWTHAMVEFSRTSDGGNTTIRNFVDYVRGLDSKYGNLVSFINEKSALLERALLHSTTAPTVF